ncbi:GGDEF domain-containing protein [Nocardioides antri]|uniref:GGDEF domain-containing protein n=1 Tax=Nocardioides antri TaxID=2607659 RepID=A0A5B1M6L3_9ACTN|nr:GGDEF domain-containing protein [Nocardioides antri]KAA1427729.1 GGDEF domain-containing protein [Nocardioides antri]
MLDTATLRVAFGVVGFCVVVLFYGVTYRTTRSPYSGWWCVSLALFLVSAMLFLCNGTPVQVVANPLGNTLAVLGAGCVWAAARSLRAASLPRWQLAVAPAVVLVASLLDDPAHDVWAGGPYFLAGMATMLGLSAYELAQTLRPPGPGGGTARQVRFTLWSLTLTSGLVALFYLLRAVVFVAVGPDHVVFRTGFGSQATTLLTMVLLVVVTFSMSELSHEQQTLELRERASHDDLTGLLNRAEFLRRAEDAFATGRRGAGAGALMVADLDGFKALNDGYGHAAGDHALHRFAAACREAVGDDGLVGRLGGDEFALLLPDGDLAEEVAARISRHLLDGPDDQPTPTVSFGVAPVDAAVGVKDTIVRADVALYQAKAAGRDRVMRYDGAG